MPRTGLGIQTHQPVQEQAPGLLAGQDPPGWPPMASWGHTPSMLSPHHHSRCPHPVRVFVWSGTQGVWKRKALCCLLYASSNREGSIMFRQLACSTFHPLLDPRPALQFKQPFFGQPPCLLRRLSRAFWKLVVGSGRKAQGFQLESSYSTHLTFTYLEIQTTRKRTRRHWPTSSWCVTPMTRTPLACRCYSTDNGWLNVLLKIIVNPGCKEELP